MEGEDSWAFPFGASFFPPISNLAIGFLDRGLKTGRGEASSKGMKDVDLRMVVAAEEVLRNSTGK